MVTQWAGGDTLLFWGGFVAALVAALYLLNWMMRLVCRLVGWWLSR